MQKIYIIGAVASGKTTLSKMLSKKLCIPCYELDSVVYEKIDGGRRKRTPDEQLAELDRIDSIGSFIVEGVYRETYHKALDIADTIIFLDTPLLIRRVRIITRFVKQQIGLERCNYRSDFKMLRLMFKWTNDFEKSRDIFTNRLNEYREKVYIAKSAKEVMEIYY